MAAEPLTTLSPAEAAVLAKILGAAPGGELLTAGLPVAATEADSGVPSATTLPEVSFLTTRIPPPAPLYLTREDVVQVELYNSVSNAAINSLFGGADNAKIAVGASGQIYVGIVVSDQLDSTHGGLFRSGNGGSSWTQLDLGEGYLLGLHFGTSAVTQPGQAYALATVIRAKFPAGTNLQTIVAGYVTASQRPGWPITPPLDPRQGPGTIRVITGTNPAPGSQTFDSVPTGARWLVLAVSFAFTTSAAVANRVISLGFFPAGSGVIFVPASATQTASLSWSYQWGQGGYTFAPANSIVRYQGIPNGIILRGPTDAIGTSTEPVPGAMVRDATGAEKINPRTGGSSPTPGRSGGVNRTRRLAG